jgi:hypothetical protein
VRADGHCSPRRAAAAGGQSQEQESRRTGQAIGIGQSGKNANLVGVFKSNTGRHDDDAVGDGSFFVVCEE